MIKRRIRECDVAPAGYGLAYFDPVFDESVAYPMGLHLLARWWRRLRRHMLTWDRSAYADTLDEQVHQARQVGYAEGRKAGRFEGHRAGREEGYRAGWVAAFERLEAEVGARGK